MTFTDPVLQEWWSTCTADEQKRLNLLIRDRHELTPCQVLDKLSGVAVCNFAIDRLVRLLDWHLTKQRLANFEWGT